VNKITVLLYDHKYELYKLRQKVTMWIAWHLPKSLVMWCYMRIAAHATTGKYSHVNACDLGMMDAVKCWED
jgi:hypothetical protein